MQLVLVSKLLQYYLLKFYSSSLIIIIPSKAELIVKNRQTCYKSTVRKIAQKGCNGHKLDNNNINMKLFCICYMKHLTDKLWIKTNSNKLPCKQGK